MGRKEKRSEAELYAREKEVARDGSLSKRLSLAKNNATHKEILYYMAEHDPDPKVRKAVAKNKSTPAQAGTILSQDKDEDVRLALAERVTALLPDIDQNTQSQLYAFAVQALGTLALDEVIKIRKALSSALKDCAQTPPKIAGQLARDIERDVSEPILRACAALSDEDLLDIINSHPESWTIQAIAGRDNVSEAISHAVIEADDIPAGKILLENENADIAVSTLEAIVEKSREYKEWQSPIAVRKTLPPELARELADFADGSVRELLTARQDFDEETIEEITVLFRRRLEFADEELRKEGMSPDQRVKELIKEGRLNEEAITDALGMRDYELVYAALAHLIGTNTDTINKIFGMHKGKPIVALCWKASLSMRTAFDLQKELGHVQPKELVYPRDGKDYPMTKDELLWHLEFLGLEAA